MSFCSTPDIPDNQTAPDPEKVGTNPEAQTPYQNTPNWVTSFSSWLKEIGLDEWKAAKDTYRPVEEELVRQVRRMAGPAYAEEQATMAGADVGRAFADRRQAAQEDLASRGLGDPSGGAYRSLQRNADIAQAGTTAAAKNAARRGATMQGLQGLSQVAGMGTQKTAAALGALGTGGGLANSAYGITSGNRNYLAGLNQAANIFNSTAQQRADIFNAQQRGQWDREQDAGMGGFGSLLGTVGGIFLSSKKLKKNRKPYKGGLSAMDKMPVQQFKYKDGVADGGEHVGPMAEDFQKATGRGDGKTIAAQDAIGVTMAAVKELHDKVRSLEDKRKKKTSDPSSEMNQPEEEAA